MKKFHFSSTAGEATVDKKVIMASTLCNLVIAGDKALWKSIFMHEMFHVFGIAHTQSRFDRYKYIEVIEDNIMPSRRNNYEICYDCTVYGPYECNSIMHYPQAFSLK